MSQHEPAIQIAVATSKGGAGKTVTTVLLACEYAHGGYRVLVIDTDPQKSATRWYEGSKAAGYRLENIEVVALGDRDEVERRVHTPGGEDIILIDMQGTATGILNSAIETADFVVIPSKVHIFDVTQALSVAKHVQETSLPYGILLTQISGIERNTAPFKAGAELLRRGGAKVLKSYLSLRPTFATVATAGSLYEFPDESQAVRDARDQANAVAAEIIQELNSGSST